MPRQILLLLLLIGLAPGLRADPARIVYHLHQVTPGTLQRALSNIENLYKGLRDETPIIHMLLQGDSLLLLAPGQLSPSHRQRLERLIRQGLILEASEINYRKLEQHLTPGLPIRLTGSIIGRLVELQKQGFQYVTP